MNIYTCTYIHIWKSGDAESLFKSLYPLEVWNYDEAQKNRLEGKTEPRFLDVTTMDQENKDARATYNTETRRI